MRNRIDMGDNQWRELRDSLPLLTVVLLVHCLLSLYNRAVSPKDEPQVLRLDSGGKSSTSKAGKGQITTGNEDDTDGNGGGNNATILPPTAICMGELGRRRAMFDLAVSAVFVVVIHGAHAIFPLSFVCGSYLLGHAVKGTRAAPFATWTMAVGMIWIKERLHGAMTFRNLLGDPFTNLDRFTGMYPWRLSFNLVVLRLVSFNLDLHWAWVGKAFGNPRKSTEVSSCHPSNSIYDYSMRVEAHRPPMDYSLMLCLGHAFYAPLYLAGPTITFNAFVSQMAVPQKSYPVERLLIYLARLCLALLLLEAGTHHLPVFALAHSQLFRKLTPADLAGFVYVILKLMWLKFLVIWRFFRLWALCDGVEPPENMERCMSNNYSIANFWKGWHCRQVFNRWLVRYIYIPLGGSSPGHRWNVFVVFIFVALWHDMEVKLVAWGLLNGLFFVVEAIVKGAYSTSHVLEGIRNKPHLNRVMRGLGAASHIMVLMMVNLIGYTVGINGTTLLVERMFLTPQGQTAVAISFAVLYTGSQVMFAVEEVRHAASRKVTIKGYNNLKTGKMAH
ncbi:unnamed protein product [Choristocarpus tenellus]